MEKQSGQAWQSQEEKQLKPQHSISGENSAVHRDMSVPSAFTPDRDIIQRIIQDTGGDIADMADTGAQTPLADKINLKRAEGAKTDREVLVSKSSWTDRSDGGDQDIRN